MAGYKERSKEMSAGEVMTALHKIAREPNYFAWEKLKWGFEYVYCEERLYLIRDIESHAMYLMEGCNPMDALENVSNMLENLGGSYD